MSDQTQAIVITICTIVAVMVWVPCLAMVNLCFKRCLDVREFAFKQHREALATAEQRVGNRAQRRQGENIPFGRAALRY